MSFARSRFNFLFGCRDDARCRVSRCVPHVASSKRPTACYTLKWWLIGCGQTPRQLDMDQRDHWGLKQCSLFACNIFKMPLFIQAVNSALVFSHSPGLNLMPKNGSFASIQMENSCFRFISARWRHKTHACVYQNNPPGFPIIECHQIFPFTLVVKSQGGKAELPDICYIRLFRWYFLMVYLEFYMASNQTEYIR